MGNLLFAGWCYPRKTHRYMPWRSFQRELYWKQLSQWLRWGKFAGAILKNQDLDIIESCHAMGRHIFCQWSCFQLYRKKYQIRKFHQPQKTQHETYPKRFNIFRLPVDEDKNISLGKQERKNSRKWEIAERINEEHAENRWYLFLPGSGIEANRGVLSKTYELRVHASGDGQPHRQVWKVIGLWAHVR